MPSVLTINPIFLFSLIALRRVTYLNVGLVLIVLSLILCKYTQDPVRGYIYDQSDWEKFVFENCGAMNWLFQRFENWRLPKRKRRRKESSSW